MMSGAVAFITAIVGIAILAAILASPNTANLIRGVGQTLSAIIGKAMGAI